jgi:hypothetical protein
MNEIKRKKYIEYTLFLMGCIIGFWIGSLIADILLEFFIQ